MTVRTLFLSLPVLLLPLLACDSGNKEEGAAANKPEAADASAATTGKKVNLNTASEDEFKALPNVGEKMAHEFEEYRPYASIQQFRKKMSKYVDDATIAEYEKHVYVPVAFNDCDAETLQQIPGVDAKGAQTLIGGRPYDDDVAFLSKVKEVGGEAAEAAALDLIDKGAG